MTIEHRTSPAVAATSEAEPVGNGVLRLSAADAATSKLRRHGLFSDGTSFYWSEGRPDQGGRQLVVSERGGGLTFDITPPGVGVRSRVHEYGGGAAGVFDGFLSFVNQEDQRLYRLDLSGDGGLVPLTRPSVPKRSTRWADVRPTSTGSWLICVEERDGPRGVRHGLTGVATDGSFRSVPLVEGAAFVAAPRVSPDGTRLAWVTWEHPNMPWDASEVWVATLAESTHTLELTDLHRVAGGESNAVGQPSWFGDGSLFFVDERSGWWLPYRVDRGNLDRPDPTAVPLVDLEAEFHAPAWGLAEDTLVEWVDGSVVCRMHSGGFDHLVRIVPPVDGEGLPFSSRREQPSAHWDWELIEQPCVVISGVAVASHSGRLAVLGSTSSESSVVVQISPDGKSSPQWLTPPDRSRGTAVGQARRGRAFVAETPAGPVPGLFYEPATSGSAGVTRPLPPLLVFCHGGPTGANHPGFDPTVQFFVGQGMAVAAVDYRGSSGYGRRYRQCLGGQWGVADVEDCLAYAEALVRAGRVDGERMAIRGTSAGGLTALGALVASDRMAGAVSWYGVTDIVSLRATAPDFESRYMEGLVGPWPEAAGEYRRRSPLHNADRISGAVLLLQGSDDPIVPLDQARSFSEALDLRGVRSELIIFEEEGHGFARASSLEAALTAELEFYRSMFDGAKPNPDPRSEAHERAGDPAAG